MSITSDRIEFISDAETQNELSTLIANLLADYIQENGSNPPKSFAGFIYKEAMQLPSIKAAYLTYVELYSQVHQIDLGDDEEPVVLECQYLFKSHIHNIIHNHW